MTRAKYHYIPGITWHLTHRCHNRGYLLKFARDRKRWRYWLFQAKKKYGLIILNYTVTSNHIHLLVHDGGERDVIPKSMLLMAGRTAWEYNRRKSRRGAFWEDQYHATAVDSDNHLNQCMVYIDLNMVRAGDVKHPRDWMFCGYQDMIGCQQRYRLIDKDILVKLFNLNNKEELKIVYDEWINSRLNEGHLKRESQWTESLAVGGKDFVDNIKDRLGIKASHRNVIKGERAFQLRNSRYPYNNDYGWKKNDLCNKING